MTINIKLCPQGLHQPFYVFSLFELWDMLSGIPLKFPACFFLGKSIENRDSIDLAGVITLSVISYFLPICRLSVTTGRGLKSGDNFKLLYDLADKLNAAGML